MNLAQEAYDQYMRALKVSGYLQDENPPAFGDLEPAIHKAWMMSTAWIAGLLTGHHDWKVKPPAALLEKQNEIMRRRLQDIANGIAIQPIMHAAAGLREVEEIVG